MAHNQDGAQRPKINRFDLSYDSVHSFLNIKFFWNPNLKCSPIFCIFRAYDIKVLLTFFTYSALVFEYTIHIINFLLQFFHFLSNCSIFGNSSISSFLQFFQIFGFFKNFNFYCFLKLFDNYSSIPTLLNGYFTLSGFSERFSNPKPQ